MPGVDYSGKADACQGMRLEGRLCIDKSGDTAILPAMFGMRLVQFSARYGVSRSGTSVILALWCLLSLTSGATQALCLDGGGKCSPSATAPVGPCHDQAPETDVTPGCGSCIDIIVPQDASAMHSRPDRELQAPQATQSLVAVNDAFVTWGSALTTTAVPPTGAPPLHPSLRTTVLRI
jgi:hypothetical protein